MIFMYSALHKICTVLVLILGSKHEKILIHIFVSLCLVVRRCQGHFGLKMFTYVLVGCLYNLVYDRCIISISGIRV